MNHSWTLGIAYACVCAIWWGLNRALPVWRHPVRSTFARPWVEVGITLLAVLATLLLGQLWVRGIRLPAQGTWAPLVESLNQILIFAPIVMVPVIRRNGWSSAWVQPDRLAWRLALGLALALVALGVYSTFEAGALSWPQAVAGVFHPTQAHLAVQVLLEDLAIAILFVRLAAALGPRVAILGVAALFAAAHVPTMLAHGASGIELLGLTRDFLLGVLILGTAWRGADIVWLWPVHFALDMTQFLGAP